MEKLHQSQPWGSQGQQPSQPLLGALLAKPAQARPGRQGQPWLMLIGTTARMKDGSTASAVLCQQGWKRRAELRWVGITHRAGR